MGMDTQVVAAAMNVHIMTQEIAARNVANVATPGFKRNMAVVESIEDGSEDGSGKPTLDHVGIDFSQGALRPTGSDLDLAIKGEGFFVIEVPKGLRYTRNGCFQLNEEREIVTQRGDRVLGADGSIQVPQGSERITVSESGEVRFGAQVVGTLNVVIFDKPQLLRQTGGCEFAAGGAVPEDAPDYKVHQGFLEGSNVNPISELVRMIASLRDYEASAKSLKAITSSASRLYAWAGS